MMLWVDKHQPRALDKIIAHEEIAQNLKKLGRSPKTLRQVSVHDCPGLLFYGPTGSGKKTLVMALLKQMFGPGVKLENKMWKIDICVKQPKLDEKKMTIKFLELLLVLVLNEVDKLSREGQHSLCRTMEKYSASCRLILCCNSSSKVTEAVRSRCLNIRVNAPTEEQIIKVLEFIGKKENLQLPPGLTARIAAHSNRNLRRAILSFETCRVQQYPFTVNQALPPLDWEQYVSEIASDIMKEQSPKRLFSVRGKIYELLVNCIPPGIILKKLLSELLKKLDSELKHEVCHWAAYYIDFNVQILGEVLARNLTCVL
ncbi:Replication factor C subunit [Musa troglodytarum]|uniref:Replication factor C subunit n=1 Tax=Musa troglodytarum TaxID=320322 RepID=A0A9E7FY64_9LILI|nr:Replication factor C subunit [Musa troglodytarum]